MKGKLIVLIVAVVVVLVLFPSVPKQILGAVGHQNPLSTLTKNNPFSVIISVLNTNNVGEISGYHRGDTEVIGDRVIMHDGPMTVSQNIWGILFIGFFLLIGWLAKSGH